MSLFQIMALVAVMCFTTASFLFALAETALLSLGDWRLRRLSENGRPDAVRVSRLLKDPAALVATLAFGTTTSNSLLVTVVMLAALQSEWVAGLTLLILLPVVLVFCEVIPKTLAARSPETWALRVAGVVQLFHWCTRPLRRIASRVTAMLLFRFVPDSVRPRSQLTDEEYEELVELAFQHGSIAQREKDIILEILRLDQQTVRDVMRPRSQMISIPDDLSTAEMVEIARRHGHRRLPIYDENPDTIVGILNVRHLLLDPGGDLADAIEFPSFVPETMNLLKLLQSFQRQKRGLAIVLDEYGGTAGLVTMTDILKELIGEIRGEGEESVFKVERVRPGEWRVNGTMTVEEFRAEYPALREYPEVDTMGGLLVSRMQIVPQAGQSVVVDGLRLIAEEVDERRVKTLSVHQLHGAPSREVAA